jgi:circadian clock protein KaiC
MVLDHTMADSDTKEVAPGALAGTGVAGLDDVLGGGWRRNRLYLAEGNPGAGKTTLAMQFLLDGVRRGERVLYVTLSESADELHASAASHGWTLDGVAIQEVLPGEDSLTSDAQSTLFHPSEVELLEATKSILARVDELRPARVVFDSLSEIRLLSGSPLRYRRQMLALKQYFGGRGTTVLLLDDRADADQHVQSIASGVLLLEQAHHEYGGDRRRLRVLKYRGTAFRGGYHDFVIERGGLRVFARLVASEHRGEFAGDKLASGVAELDSVLGQGIELGTSTLIVGAAGTGKSTLAAQFVASAANQGKPGAAFLFDESPAMLLNRCRDVGIALGEHVQLGRVTLTQVDPAELTPGELVHAIRGAVEERGARVVVLDSLNGYMNAMPDVRFLESHLHELLAYLGQRGVATLLVGAHSGLIGAQMSVPVEASYLADSVVLLRYFEAAGEVRQAISIVKKRGSCHERTLREFRLGDGGITIGPPLREFRGILTGVPVYEGQAGPLFGERPQ